MMKRAFDFIGALSGLILLSPLFLVVIFGQWLVDRGPAFFAQARVGMNGDPFRMWKFRSMRVANSGPSLTVGADARITPMGRILRKTKIDELPQLWNVLKGDMSLVGPRPELKKYVDLYSPAEREVLNLRPGITDPASFALFDESELLARSGDPEAYYRQVLMPEKIRVNIEYARRAGFVSDLLLIFATVVRIVGVELDVFGKLGMKRPSFGAPA